MKHYYIKAVGYEREEYPKPITSIQFQNINEHDIDKVDDKISVSVELKGEIVAVFAIYKEDLKDAVKWLVEEK